MRPAPKSTRRRLSRSVAVAGILLLGAACSGGSGSKSSSPASGSKRASVNIPRPGAQSTTPPPNLVRSQSMPSDTTSLMDDYNQGRAQVYR